MAIITRKTSHADSNRGYVPYRWELGDLSDDSRRRSVPRRGSRGGRCGGRSPLGIVSRVEGAVPEVPPSQG